MGGRKASHASLSFYERGAQNMIRAAAAAQGVDMDGAPSADRLDALVRHLEAGGTICAGTVAVYRQQSRIACDRIAGDGTEGDRALQAALAARNALAKRLGRPDPPQGPSRKLKDPTHEELGDVFAHLRTKFFETGDLLDLMLALYIAVAPRIGLRPVELTWASWDGNSLWVRTAKRAGRPKRCVPHEHWPPAFKMALGLLIKLVPREMDEEAFRAWCNVLASRLARASKWTRTRRRLSLYCTRHIAIATWKQIGLSAELIVRLAGHAGLRSQHHYASGRSGYGARYVFVTEAEAQVLLGGASLEKLETPSITSRIGDGEERAGIAAGRARAGAGYEGGQKRTMEEEVKEASYWEEFPQPPPKAPSPPGEDLWRKYSERQDAELAQLQAYLRRIRTERQRPQKPDGDEKMDS